MENIQLLVLFSGKRKSGKDFLTERLQKALGSKDSQIVRISGPIKAEWAKKLDLDLAELLSDGPYKENYRKQMLEWSNELRSKDYAYFCKLAIKEGDHKIVLVSDIRRKGDIKYFREQFGEKLKTIRINCTEEVRRERGWIFQPGVDDGDSECDLDDVTDWDLEISNNSDAVDDLVDQLATKCREWLKNSEQNSSKMS